MLLFDKFYKQTLCLFGRLDAEFGAQGFFHSFEMLLNRGRFALGSERFHHQPMHVLAKRIACQGFAGVPQRIGPVFFCEGELCESGNDTCGLLGVKLASFLGPIFINAEHKFPTTEFVSGFETCPLMRPVFLAFGFFSFDNPLLEFFCVDGI